MINKKNPQCLQIHTEMYFILVILVGKKKVQQQILHVM